MSTQSLARWSAVHPWLTLAAWLGGIGASVVASVTLLGGALTTEGRVTNNPDSIQGYELLAERFPRENVATELAVMRSETLTVDEVAFGDQVREFGARARAVGAIESFVAYGDDPSLVSPDRHAVLVPIRLAFPNEESADRLIALVKDENGKDGFQVALTGSFTTDRDFNEQSQHDLQHGELAIGLPAALFVLVLVFGALVTAALPLILAIVSIVVAIGLTAVLAQGFELSVFVVNMITGMGFALGIDYALFVVSRVREERAKGRDRIDAIAVAGGTASRAVLFSGSAFVIAMAGLLLVQSTIMRSLAAGAIVVGIASVAAALTLLPAVLSLLGDRLNRLHIPFFGRGISDQAGRESRFWGAIVRRVIRRPAVSLVAAVAVLVALAVPVLGLEIGALGIGTLPDRLVSKQGYLALERSFPAAGAEPAQIVVEGDADAPAVKRGVTRLTEALSSDDDFGPAVVSVAPARDLTLVSVPVASDALSDRAIMAVERLRADYVRAAFDGVEARVLVTGSTAENIDYFDVMRRWLPIVIAVVLGLSFLLLTLAFRSVVVAATAIVLNLLSVGAAYGLVVLVFQHGVAADVLGFTEADRIEAWVPLFLFAVLFGLSMDYQVFLLSRIRERYARTGDTADAVVFGIGSTARIITGAALIIVAVFVGFAAGDLVMFQQMGFGIAVALLVDATVVRSVLVPAAMQLLGERNWYLPRALGWLPHIDVEGDPGAASS